MAYEEQIGADYSGDQGDETDGGIQQCEQDIEDLEARVSAIEQKLGIQSPADEQESPMGGMKPAKAKPIGPMPFIGGQ